MGELSPATLPPLLADIYTRLKAGPETITHLGHVAGLENVGSTISTPAVKICGDVTRSNASVALHQLEGAGVLEPFQPDDIPRGGKLKGSQTRYLTFTDLGRELVPPLPPEECGLNNPLDLMTPTKRQLVLCGLCHLARNSEFTGKQVASCLNKGLPGVDGALSYLVIDGVFKRELREVPGLGHTGGKVYRYTQATEGLGASIPVRQAEDCPQQNQPPEEKIAPLPGLTQPQLAIMGTLAELYHEQISGIDSQDFLVEAIMKRSAANYGPVYNLLQRLTDAGYLRKELVAGAARRTFRYNPTEQGIAILQAHTPEAVKTRILSLCLDMVTVSQLSQAETQLQALNSTQTIELYVKIAKKLTAGQKLTFHDLQGLMNALY